ncbi:MAG: Nif11 family protein [Crocosphaera sp.]
MLSESSQKFNEYLIQFPELQTKLTSIKSPFDLINFAKEEGFELTIDNFKELAQHAFHQWLIKVDPSVRLFIEKVDDDKELDRKFHQCTSINDLINLAQEYNVEITSLEMERAAEIAKSFKGFSFEKTFFQNLTDKS